MIDGITIKSIGWSFRNSTGGYSAKDLIRLQNEQLSKDIIFKSKFKNFGRLDDISKAVCTAIALALQGVKLYPNEGKQPISLFLSNDMGSLASDQKYFTDFVDFDKTAGRANLFLYTLPSSPLGEASVHFGLTGKIAYFATVNDGLTEMYNAIEDGYITTLEKSNNQYLVGIGNSSKTANEAIFLLLSDSNIDPLPNSKYILDSIFNFDQLKNFIEKELTI